MNLADHDHDQRPDGTAWDFIEARFADFSSGHAQGAAWSRAEAEPAL